MVRVQVHIMSHKVEEDYNKKVEQEQNERTQEQLLEALDKIRAPICVCEIGQADTKVLFANHTWTTLAGAEGVRHGVPGCLLVDMGRCGAHNVFPCLICTACMQTARTYRDGAIIILMPNWAIM